jgi:hypothetical protein
LKSELTKSFFFSYTKIFLIFLKHNIIIKFIPPKNVSSFKKDMKTDQIKGEKQKNVGRNRHWFRLEGAKDIHFGLPQGKQLTDKQHNFTSI